ncbi:MarR family transcriptional regulator [Bradyrhizobium zhanjiangense]|uniref:MarR family transcriptional regulator n=1 Tax=Bradyrhizobium zhanjiangense TaxID=1325107 RepID=UPI001008FB8E
MPPDLPDPASALGRISTDGVEIVRSFMWEIRSIRACLEELAKLNVLGITRPRWTILMAVNYLGKERRVPVNLVSRLMLVDPSFVTTHSKLLEKNGLLRHKSSADDARSGQMSLTAKTRKHLRLWNHDRQRWLSSLLMKAALTDQASSLPRLLQ